jgi:hypothetical protein
MLFENIVLEIFGIFVLIVAPFILLNMITISPIILPFNFLYNFSNDVKIIILPLIMYALIRIYCIIVSFVSDFVNKKVTIIKPQLIKLIMLGSVGFMYFRDDSVQLLLSNILYSYFGNLPEVIYNNTKNDFLIVCQYGIRLICVITIWWVVILTIEQFLGYILSKLWNFIFKILNSIYLIIFRVEKVDSDKKSD